MLSSCLKPKSTAALHSSINGYPEQARKVSLPFTMEYYSKYNSLSSTVSYWSQRIAFCAFYLALHDPSGSVPTIAIGSSACARHNPGDCSHHLMVLLCDTHLAPVGLTEPQASAVAQEPEPGLTSSASTAEPFYSDYT